MVDAKQDGGVPAVFGVQFAALRDLEQTLRFIGCKLHDKRDAQQRIPLGVALSGKDEVAGGTLEVGRLDHLPSREAARGEQFRKVRRCRDVRQVIAGLFVETFQRAGVANPLKELLGCNG